MSICASGSSNAQPGVASAIVVDQAYVQSLLPAGLAWLYPYLPFMQGLQIGSVSAFCAADPPTFSVPTGPQLFNFLTGGAISDYELVNTFIQNVTRAFLWSRLCQCSNGVIPAPPAPPSPPAALPDLNPGRAVTLTSGNPCSRQQGEMDGDGTATPATFGQYAVFGENFHNMPMPANTTHVRYTIVNTVFGASHNRFSLNIQSRVDTSTAFTLLASGFVPSGTTLVLDADVPVGHRLLDSVCTVDPVGSITTDKCAWTVEMWCGGPPGTGCSACPPDPVLMGRINQLLGLVTLLQRRQTPFASIDGTVHAGLTGTGTFSAQGLLGVKVHLTTVPTNFAQLSGAPNYILMGSWLSASTPDGFIDETRVHAIDQVWMPRLASDATTWGYQFANGVVGTVTELLPEP